MKLSDELVEGLQEADRTLRQLHKSWSKTRTLLSDIKRAREARQQPKPEQATTQTQDPTTPAKKPAPPPAVPPLK